jgi:hypothetical protein
VPTKFPPAPKRKGSKARGVPTGAADNGRRYRLARCCAVVPDVWLRAILKRSTRAALQRLGATPLRVTAVLRRGIHRDISPYKADAAYAWPEA